MLRQEGIPTIEAPVPLTHTSNSKGDKCMRPQRNIIFAILATAFMVFAIQGISYGEATVLVVPEDENPAVGDTLVVNINIQGGENVGAYQITVTFDSNVLTLDKIENADYLPLNDVFPAEPQFEEGKVTFAATVVDPKTDGADGDGTLAKATFTVQASDPTTIGLEGVILSDPGGNILDVVIEDGEVNSVAEPDPEPAEPVDIPDPNLRAKIETALDKQAGDPITVEEMATLTHLEAPDANISVLIGLEHATNLTWLGLVGNSISDISAVTGLTKLTRLSLGGNSLSDISAVTGLTKLTSLGLGGNSLSDISAVTGLTNLTGLDLGYNSISDISAVTGLTNLTGLNLGYNSISDISAVTGLTNLTGLSLYNNSLSDISAVTGLTKLTRLSLSSNSISDISAVTGLTNLTSLRLGGNSLSDISAVTGLTNLTWLNLGGNSLSDISAVTGLTNLTRLYLYNNSLSDISAVTGLTNLTELNLGGNSLSDISAVTGLTNLTELNLGGNSLSDISAVTGLTKLTDLYLWDNSISDISPLVTNTGLGDGDTINVRGNPLNYSSFYTHIPILQSRGVTVQFDDRTPTTFLKISGTITESDNVLVVEVRDGEGQPFAGVPVTFTVTSGGGTLSVTSTTTDTDGRAESTLILGADGENTVSASVEGISEPVTFSDVPDPTVENSMSWEAEHYTAINGDAIKTLNPIFKVTDGYGMEFEITEASNDAFLGVPNGTENASDAWLKYEFSIPVEGDWYFWGRVIAPTSADNSFHWAFDITDADAVSYIGTNIWDFNESAGGSINFPLGDGITAEEKQKWIWFRISSRDGPFPGRGSYDNPTGINFTVGQHTLHLIHREDGTYIDNFFATTDAGFNPNEARMPTTIDEGIEFDLSLPSGISLIHIPLKVTAVDGVSKTIESVGDLYDALGGSANVSVLITYNTQTQRWNSYLGDRYRGRPGDRILTDDLGIIASMKAPTAIRLSGAPLGTNGSSSITLHPGLNLVGVPLKDSRITKVSDLLALDGIRDNVSVIIVKDGKEFKVVGRATDDGNIAITGGGSFILTAREMATVAITGDGWANAPGTTAASPMALTGIQVAESTPILAVTGSIVSSVDGASLPRLLGSGFRVTIKNLSTGKADTAVTDDDSVGYQLTFVELETGRAAQIGDTLEISAQSPNPLVGVQPLRYVITAEDVKRGHIQLGELITYEIPAKTELLRNYPNPFNPETWIPYRLAEDANVTLTIYDLSGGIVRRLDIGHQIAAVYESRAKAIYWDGRTEFGERVASGIYFYHLSAGDYSATRKMVILK